MNKRIQELINQSYDTVPHERDWDATSQIFNKEKFSKLLIKECLLQVADVRIENDFEPIADAALVKVINGINKHFGITA